MSDADTPDAPWRVIHPEGAAKAVGYSNGVLARDGRLSVAGQVDMGPDGTVAHPGDLEAQAAGAFANVAAVVKAAGGRPEHVVRMRVFVADVEEYKAKAAAIGRAYREHFGRWYPAMTLVQISRFYDADALIEVEAEAVLPG